jgi:hypothetical protein
MGGKDFYEEDMGLPGECPVTLLSRVKGGSSGYGQHEASHPGSGRPTGTTDIRKKEAGALGTRT